MRKKECLELLSLTEPYTDVELKKAYKRFAMIWHPDRSGVQNEFHFVKGKEAYIRLKNWDFSEEEPIERKKSTGLAKWVAPQAEEKITVPTRHWTLFKNTNPIDGEDIFVEVELKHILKKEEVVLKYRQFKECRACFGFGLKQTMPLACAYCQGSGRVRRRKGLFSWIRECPSCKGCRVEKSAFCNSCLGLGQISVKKNLTLKQKKEIKEGFSIVFEKEGHEGRFGGICGDFVVKFIRSTKGR